MKNIDNIIQEIFELDPTLREHEVEVRRTIEILLQSRPEPEIDASFIAELRLKLENATVPQATVGFGNFFTNFMNRPKQISYAFMGAAGLAVLALVIVPFIRMSPLSPSRDSLSRSNRPNIVSLSPSAFGKLAFNGGVNTGTQSVQSESDSSSAGAPSKMMAPAAPLGSPEAMSSRPQSGGGAGVATDMRIWPNFPPASLKFTGDPIELKESAMAVYRRVVNRDLAAQFGSAVANLPNGLIDLSRQGNLQLLNVQLVTPGSDGLSYNLDLREGRLYISQYYEGIYMPERPMTEGDILPDSEIVTIADRFLKDTGIDMSSYGAGVVDQQWMIAYRMEKAANGNSASTYIPSIMNVTYPLVIDGQTIYDMSGNPSGVSVQVNMLTKRVVGAGNISVLNFEKSDYAIETDFAKIVSIAEKGGIYGYWYPSENIKELQLGTPELIYTVHYQYDERNGQNKELYVPALRFPITNAPQDSYYGPKNIVVPIAKDILEAQQKTIDVMPVEPGPAILPTPEPMPLDSSSSSSSSPKETTTR